MKILRLLLKNFKGIKSGTGLNEIVLDFSKTDKRKIILSGLNGSGKTTILSALHPYSETFDIRKNIIIEGKEGRKEIDFLTNDGILYEIIHVYVPKKNKSFISKTDLNEETPEKVELNPNGNVTSFVQVIEEEFGLTKELFKLIKIGGSSENFIDLIASKRKEYLSNFIPSVDEYIEAYSNVNGKLNAINKEIKFISSEVDKLSSEDELNKNLTLMDSTLKSLRNNLTNLMVDKNTHEKSLAEAANIESQVLLINTEIGKYKMKNDEIKHDLESLDRRANGALSKRDFNSTVIGELLSTVQKNLSTYKDKFSESKGRLGATEDQLQSVKDGIKKLSSDYNKLLESTNGKDLAEIQELNKLLQGYEEELSKYNTFIQEKTGDVYTVNELIDEDFRESVNDTLNEYEKLVAFLNGVIENIASYRVDEDFLPEGITYKSSTKQVEEYIKSNQSLKDDLENDLKVLNKELEDLRTNTIEYKSISKHLDKCDHPNCGLVHFIKLNSNISQKNEKMEELNSEIKAKKENISEIDGMVENLASFLFFRHKFIDNQSNDVKEFINLINTDITEEFVDSNIYFLPQNTIKKEIIDSILKDHIPVYEKLKRAIVTATKIFRTNTEIEAFSKVESRIISIHEQTQKEQEKLNTLSATHKELMDEYSETETKIAKVTNSETTLKMAVAFLNDMQLNDKEIDKLKKNLHKYTEEIEIIKTLRSTISELEEVISETEESIDKLENDRNKTALSKERVSEYKTRLGEIEDNKLKLTILKEALDVKTGIPLIKIGDYLEPIKAKTNALLGMIHKGRFLIDFNLSDNEFSIPVYKNGHYNSDDIKECSAGEVALVKVSLSLGIIDRIIRQTGNRYNLIYLDEVDSELDYKIKPKFISMVDTQMNSLGCDQCFIITHNECFDAEEAALIILKDSKIDTTDEDFMHNKDVIFNINE